jgi:hypothetical protein
VGAFDEKNSRSKKSRASVPLNFDRLKLLLFDKVCKE